MILYAVWGSVLDQFHLALIGSTESTHTFPTVEGTSHKELLTAHPGDDPHRNRPVTVAVYAVDKFGQFLII